MAIRRHALACLLPTLIAAGPALAQPEPEPAPPPADPQPAPDPHAARRDALLDVGFGALADGDLDRAERAFVEAAELPGAPEQAAVAASLADRVRRLRARRQALRGRPAGPAQLWYDREDDRAGRVPFLLTTTALGLGLWGWSFPTAVGVDSSDSTRTWVGLYMLTAATSFVLPYLATRTGPLDAGQANLAFYGGTRGAWHGLLLTALVAGELAPDVRQQGWAASLLVGSLGELAGGYAFARSHALSAGEARTIAVLGDFGLLSGFGFGFLLDADAGPADPAARKMSAAGLVGSVLGLGGGYLLARSRDNTWGDGEVMRAAMLVGGWSGLMLTVVSEVDPDAQLFPLPAMAGGALGLLAGDALVRNTSFGVGQSIILDVATLAGALAGAGGTYLMTGEGKPVAVASAVGATVGFGLAYWAMWDRPAGKPRAAGAPHVALLPMVGTEGQRGLALAGAF